MDIDIVNPSEIPQAGRHQAASTISVLKQLANCPEGKAVKVTCEDKAEVARILAILYNYNRKTNGTIRRTSRGLVVFAWNEAGKG